MRQTHRIRTGGVAAALVVAFSCVFAGAAVPAGAAPVAGAAPGTGFLRVGHFVPGAGAVSVDLDGRPLAPGLAFQQVSSYAAVPAGTHTVAFAGGMAGQGPSAAETVAPGQSLTVLLTKGASGSLRLTSFADDLSQPPSGDAKVRVVDTMPTIAAVGGSLSTVAGQQDPPPAALGATPEGEASPYVDVAGGTYDVRLTNASTGTTVLTGNSWPVAAGTVASLVVLQGGNGPTLEVLKDAVGAASMPRGGMRTGAGGMAMRAQRAASQRRDIEFSIVAAVALGGLVLARRSRRNVGLVAVACASGLVATSCGGQASLRSLPPPPTTAGSTGWTPVAPAAPSVIAPGGGGAPSVNLAGAGTADPSDQPERIAAPAVGINAAIVNLGRLPDGTMQVPSDFSVAGWYDQGPPPGAPGPAVIVGHIDNTSGPAVFWRLGDLRPGDDVSVTSAQGTETFLVTSLQTVAKDVFPTAEVFGPTPDPELRLITCSGSFDRSTRHYVDNTVVFARQAPT